MMNQRTLFALSWPASLILLTMPLLLSVNAVTAQITRDVGEISVIEADNEIFIEAVDASGNPCSLMGVSVQAVARKFYESHDDVFQFLIMFTTFNHLLLPSNCNETASAFHLPAF